MNTIIESLQQFWQYTGFANMTYQHLIMVLIGIACLVINVLVMCKFDKDGYRRDETDE